MDVPEGSSNDSPVCVGYCRIFVDSVGNNFPIGIETCLPHLDGIRLYGRLGCFEAAAARPVRVRYLAHRFDRPAVQEVFVEYRF